MSLSTLATRNYKSFYKRRSSDFPTMPGTSNPTLWWYQPFHSAIFKKDFWCKLIVRFVPLCRVFSRLRIIKLHSTIHWNLWSLSLSRATASRHDTNGSHNSGDHQHNNLQALIVESLETLVRRVLILYSNGVS